jgi:single-stranded-DNA-specific exonuclease
MARPDLTTLLDLVAVGTVADLVALDPNNRALVSAGLRRLRAGQGCVGLRALIEASGRDAARLTATDIGFSARPAPECRGPAGRHGAGHRAAADRRPAPGARDRADAGADQLGTARRAAVDDR